MPPVSNLQFKEIVFVSPDDKDDICKIKCYVANDTFNKIKIEFEYNFSKPAALREFPKSHPFYENQPYAIQYSDYIVVTKNSLTSELVSFLTMNDDDLAKLTGAMSPMLYRKTIMTTLAMFCEF